MTTNADLQNREALREAAADRIVRLDDFKRNPNGRVLIPENAFKHEVEPSLLEMLEEEKALSPDEENGLAEELRKEFMSPKPKQAARKAKAEMPFKRCVPVFKQEEITKVKQFASSSTGEVKRRYENGLKTASAYDGFRQIPNFKNFDAKLNGVRLEFGNFAQVIEYLSGELMLTAVSKPETFGVRPILLDGAPGVGKTAFAQRIAKELGLPYLKISAGGLQHAFVFTGSASQWGNSHTGEIFNLIARSSSASAVILIDEVDKISDRSDYAILPALLDLLEPESSARYREESLGLSFDASRLIILLTSNRKREIDPALLSRCSVFDIENPGVQQKVIIAIKEFEQYNANMTRGNQMSLDLDAVQRLAERNIDVRTLINAVKSGVVKAIKNGEKTVRPVLDTQKERTHHFGFINSTSVQ